MHYEKESLREVIVPIGGIGTGSIGICGNGRFLDWEICNRPNKGSTNGYSHLAIRAEYPDGHVDLRVLNGDFTDSYMGQYLQSMFIGYGYGPDHRSMCALPHFAECTVDTEYPFATFTFRDESFPADVMLTAYNPLIPGDALNSSLPCALFDVRVKSKVEDEIHYTVVLSVSNLFSGGVNTDVSNDDGAVVTIRSTADPESPEYGDLTLLCEGDAFAQSCWYRGGWMDSVTTYWRQLAENRTLPARTYEGAGRDTASVGKCMTVARKGEATASFALCWNVPNCYNYSHRLRNADGKDFTWKNYYATVFEDSSKTAEYVLKNRTELYRRGRLFTDAFYAQTLDPAVIEAASSNLSVLKSPTVLRLADGSFYGWEGVHEKAGSCEGTCQHVWNYAYALCFLFPELERSIRDLEFKYSMQSDGEMYFRMGLPIEKHEGYEFEVEGHKMSCLDGQMGCVFKTYREWKLCGDDAWLRKQIGNVEKVLEYAWSETNAFRWDRDRDGILEGRQHHTLDMELFGPSSWLQGFYLLALSAAAEMEEYLGNSEKADEYRALYENGRAFANNELFNGEYFIHKVDLKDRSIPASYGCEEQYWNEETGEIKYQIGEGSEIDQLCGQWHASILGLPRIFDEDKTKTALHAMYRNNFKKRIGDMANFWRVFAVNDESATIMCDYPDGTYKPTIPVPYCEEAMTGFEYQLAGLMMSEGMIEEGLMLVRAIRDRYDGIKRNPFNEIECGSHYARSMASYALVPILEGFVFDLPRGEIGFDPKVSTENFRGFFSVFGAFGEVLIDCKRTEIRILEGELSLSALSLPYCRAKRLVIDGHTVDFEAKDRKLYFQKQKISRCAVITAE